MDRQTDRRTFAISISRVSMLTRDKNCCHQMTEYYNAPNYSAHADPLAGFHGPTSKGREGRGGKGDARGGDGREEKGGSGGRKGGGCPVFP